MTLKEKKLYHQIHPLKLVVDISSGLFATYLLWQHNTNWFLILFLLPSIIVSLLLVKLVNFENLKNSKLGKYIQKYMTLSIETVRLGGQIVMWIAGWYHLTFLIGIGFLIIFGDWCNGLLFKRNKFEYL